jgi:outer membrane protein FlgP
MKHLFVWVLSGLLLAGLSGCAGTGGSDVSAVKPKSLRASGFSRLDDTQTPFDRMWMQAQQAAKLSAYRSLADSLYQETLEGGKTVGSQVMSDEAYRVYVDTYLREARAVDTRNLKDSLKTTLELNLTPRFFRCMSGNVEVVRLCLQADHKSALTRLGLNQAKTTMANLACGVRDCSDQLSVQGFTTQRNPVDDALLNAGLYDAEWSLSTSAGVFSRVFLFRNLLY